MPIQAWNPLCQVPGHLSVVHGIHIGDALELPRVEDEGEDNDEHCGHADDADASGSGLPRLDGVDLQQAPSRYA